MPTTTTAALLVAAAAAGVAMASTCSAPGCIPEESEEVGLLQAKAQPAAGAGSARSLLSRREGKAMVCIFTTGGSEQLSCGECPDSSSSKCGIGRRMDNRTLQMAMAVKEGVEEYGGVDVTLHDIRFEGGCPSETQVATNCDAIILGSPVWTAMPATDMVAFSGKWSRKGNKFICKIGAAFTTGQAMYAGTENVMRILHSRLMTLQMLIVGGSDWQTNPGAAAVTGHGAYKTDKGDSSSFSNAESLLEHSPDPVEEGAFTGVDEMFLSQGRGLGFRVAAVVKVAFEGNLTKTKEGACQLYPGLKTAPAGEEGH